MHQAGLVSRVQSRRHLNRNIENKLAIVSRNVQRQVNVHPCNEIVHIAAIVHLCHLKVQVQLPLIELLECNHDVGVADHVNPPVNVFAGVDLLYEELLPEIFMIDDEACL